ATPCDHRTPPQSVKLHTERKTRPRKCAMMGPQELCRHAGSCILTGRRVHQSSGSLEDSPCHLLGGLDPSRLPKICPNINKLECTPAVAPTWLSIENPRRDAVNESERVARNIPRLEFESLQGRHAASPPARPCRRTPGRSGMLGA